MFVEGDVDPARKEMVDQILKEHLPQGVRPPVPPPKPPEWMVCVAEQQQSKAPRRAIYDCLRKHHIPHRVASPNAQSVQLGMQVKIPLKERQRAQSIVDELRQLGLVAEVIEPVTQTSSSSARKEMRDQILTEHLPQVGPGYVTASDGFSRVLSIGENGNLIRSKVPPFG